MLISVSVLLLSFSAYYNPFPYSYSCYSQPALSCRLSTIPDIPLFQPSSLQEEIGVLEICFFISVYSWRKKLSSSHKCVVKLPMAMVTGESLYLEGGHRKMSEIRAIWNTVTKKQNPHYFELYLQQIIFITVQELKFCLQWVFRLSSSGMWHCIAW
jgi:hypothetical protein